MSEGKPSERDESEETGQKEAGKDRNGNGLRPRGLIHSVSIFVETVLDDCDDSPALGGEQSYGKHSNECHESRELSHVTELSTEVDRLPVVRRERHQSSPIIFLDDHHLSTSKDEGSTENQVVQSIIATARLRKEAFARLLDEHAELVNEINRAETSRV